ncbi:MAG TPA: heavy metal-associated domain-containing protein [Tepidisphaeraceae bacterium]
MPQDVGQDQLLIVRIEGMHCHKCEHRIKKSLLALPGVHEVEVDFLSAQASVLYDRKLVSVKQLLDGVTEAGYQTNGFTQPQPHADRA